MFKHRQKLIALRGLMLVGSLLVLAGCGGAADPAADSSSSPASSVAVPAAPTGLAATAGNAQASLTWSASSGATSYNVSRSTTSGGPYTQLAATTSAAYTDTSVVNGTAYFYVVAAVSSAGESADSAQASVTPDPTITTPAVPTGLSATPGNAQVSLTWSASSGATGYHVKRASTSGGPYTQVGAPASVAYTDTAVTNGTTYYYVVSALDTAGESANSAQVSATVSATPGQNATITVTASATQPISPYIYGVNGASPLSNQLPAGTSSALPTGLTLDRFGGNRLTAYNWTTNASNAGSDYLYENDSALNTTPNSPGSAVSQRITFDQSIGMATLVTFPLQGLVAADEAGPVSLTNPPAAGRFDAVQYAKGSSFTTNPPLTGTVYDDEFAYNINNDFSGQGIFSASPTKYPVFGELDNEPDLWSDTHPEIQTATAITPSAFITNTISLAMALKGQYPQMVIFGPVNWGWSGVQSWQGAIAGTTNTSTNWFIDQYAQALATASASFGAPLINVYDFHWYPQVVDPVSGNQLGNVDSASLADSQTQLIVQWPRSLYDSTYVEDSWIPGTIGNNAINALPRFQAKLATDNPGMKLAITEYFPGGGGTIAGTIAEADLLGAFGANGLFAANLWPLVSSFPYVTAGFRAFRDFDGAGSNFGNTAVAASSSAIANVSAYVSTDTTRPGRVVMVLINRSNAAQATTISGQTVSGTAHFFQMSAATAAAQTTVQPVASGTQAVSGSSLTVSLPSLSVTTVDIY